MKTKRPAKKMAVIPSILARLADLENKIKALEKWRDGQAAPQPAPPTPPKGFALKLGADGQPGFRDPIAGECYYDVRDPEKWMQRGPSKWGPRGPRWILQKIEEPKIGDVVVGADSFGKLHTGKYLSREDYGLYMIEDPGLLPWSCVSIWPAPAPPKERSVYARFRAQLKGV